MNNKVSVVKCDRYSEVQNAVENAVSLIGGIGKFVKKGDNVVIKPNLVSKKKPEEAVTTNPEFLHAVIVMVEKAGGNVTIAESPGGPYNTAALKGVYSVCGVDKAIEGTNAKLNFDTSFTEVHFPEGKTVKKIPIINPILNADVIISLPKLKTHAMTSYTGAVKNLFGTIPGTYKAELHFDACGLARMCKTDIVYYGRCLGYGGQRPDGRSEQTYRTCYGIRKCTRA